MLSSSTELRDKLEANAKYFKEALHDLDWIQSLETALSLPIMLYDAKLSQDFADGLLKEGVYAIGFFYPVVPKESAYRFNLSRHSIADLDKALQPLKK